MPQGFRGNPTKVYLTEAQDAHNAAVAVGRRSVHGVSGSRVVPLPYQPSAARTGSYTTGYGNSENIVTNQSEYETVARMVSERDDRMGELIYMTANDIEEMCRTIFVLPSATPSIVGLSGEIKQSLSAFRSATEEMANNARSFADAIVSVG